MEGINGMLRIIEYFKWFIQNNESFANLEYEEVTEKPPKSKGIARPIKRESEGAWVLESLMWGTTMAYYGCGVWVSCGWNEDGSRNTILMTKEEWMYFQEHVSRYMICNTRSIV